MDTEGLPTVVATLVYDRTLRCYNILSLVPQAQILEDLCTWNFLPRISTMPERTFIKSIIRNDSLSNEKLYSLEL